MTKQRAIYGTAATSLSLARCSIEAQLLFDRLITAADDQGRLQGDPLVVKANCVPLAGKFTVRRVDWCLGELATNGMVIRYEAHEQPMLQIVKWWEHQGWMRHAYASRWPAPKGWEDRLKGGGIAADERQDADEMPQNDGTAPADGRHDDGRMSASDSGGVSEGVVSESELTPASVVVGNGAPPPEPADLFLRKTLTTHYDQTRENPSEKGIQMYRDLLRRFGPDLVQAAQWRVGPGKGYGYIAKVKAECQRGVLA
jgi:hypothetical protein